MPSSQPVIEVKPDHFTQTLVQSVLGGGLVPPDALPTLREQRGGPMIVVAAPPRSGSTFLSNVLSRVTGLPYVRLCSAYSTNEHDLYLPALYVMNRVGCVSQMHMKGTFHNAALARAFDVRLILLVRRLADCLVSLREDLRKKEKLQGFGNGAEGFSFIWQDDDLARLDDPSLLDALIDLAAPWYVNYLVSWSRLVGQGLVQARWVQYEKLMADPRGVVLGLLDSAGVPAQVDRLEAAVRAKYETFHIGRAGRGEETMSEAQASRLRRLIVYYPGVDFSPFGL
ncbi:MAG: sulfotransferase domain-containing protein [Nitrospirae bacterium]|nr:sulfotransferase domain-containing protein [Nitrospirota bacterium]